MQQPPRIPELTQRDRFLREAARHRKVYAVAGEEGLARVPSRKIKGREVTLVWTSRAEAERWSAALTLNPRVKEIELAAFLNSVLPKLAELKRLVGPDWSSEPVEAELDPIELGEKLRLAALDGFVAAVIATGTIWTLEGSNGPAMLVSATRPDVLVLPCWSERAQAEVRAEGPWAEMFALAIPVATFVSTKLPWLAEHGWLVSPDHTPGEGAFELEPADLAQDLAKDLSIKPA